MSAAAGSPPSPPPPPSGPPSGPPSAPPSGPPSAPPSLSPPLPPPPPPPPKDPQQQLLDAEEAERIRIDNNIRAELLSTNSQLRCGEIILDNGNIEFTCCICNHQETYQSYQCLSNHLTQKHNSIFNFFGWPEGIADEINDVPDPNYGNYHQANYNNNNEGDNNIENQEEVEEEGDNDDDEDDEMDSDDSGELSYEIPFGNDEQLVVAIVNNDSSSSDSHSCRNSYNTNYSKRTISESGNDELEIKLFQCNICNDIYTNTTELGAHKRIKHTLQKKIYRCLMCKRHLPTYVALLRHKHFHSINRFLPCRFCNKAFGKRGKLFQHERTEHSKEELPKPADPPPPVPQKFFCWVCSVEFPKNIHLKRHLRTHRNTKKFECKKCDGIFSSRCKLTRHNVIHVMAKLKQNKLKDFVKKIACSLVEEKPFGCDYCDESFGTGLEFENHRYDVHYAAEEELDLEMAADENIPDILDKENQQQSKKDD